MEGVAPSADTVKDGTYTLARPFNIVTNGEAADPVAVDFIAYCMSTDGQALATEEGYIGDEGEDYTSAQPEGKITVGGSSSVSPLMEKLIEAYKTVNPNAELELLTTDSTTGVSGALDGTYTIGMASRELKDSEVEGGAKATVLAKDGIAVIVSNDNPTDNLTVDLHRRADHLGRRSVIPLSKKDGCCGGKRRQRPFFESHRYIVPEQRQESMGK